MPKTKPPASEPEAPPSAPSQPGMQMHMGRFLVLFLVSLAILFGLLLAPVTQPSVISFTRWLVTASAAIIRFFGGHARAFGDLLEDPITHFQIRMAYGCNGAHVTILLWSALLAFPATWQQKAKGILVGTFAIHAVNLIRFISLYYVGQYNQSWFDFAHLYLWESLMMLDTLVVFWTWAYMVRKAEMISHASTR